MQWLPGRQRKTGFLANGSCVCLQLSVPARTGLPRGWGLSAQSNPQQRSEGNTRTELPRGLFLLPSGGARGTMVLDPADSCFLLPAQYWAGKRQAPATGHPSAAAITRAQDSSPGSLRFGGPLTSFIFPDELCTLLGIAIHN